MSASLSPKMQKMDDSASSVQALSDGELDYYEIVVIIEQAMVCMSRDRAALRRSGGAARFAPDGIKCAPIVANAAQQLPDLESLIVH